MKTSEIRERSDEELVQLESELRRNIWKARFDNHASKLDDTASIAKARRDLARVKTIQTQRAAQAGRSPK